jgi:predicted TIM-barrel fold metal-dependent hydrolase
VIWIFFHAGYPYRPEEPLPKAIMDMHCHVGGIGAGGSGCFVSGKFRKDLRYRLFLCSFGFTEKKLREKGDDLLADRISEMVGQSKLVDKAVLLAWDGVYGNDGELDKKQTQVYVPNEFVVRAVARHTNLLFGASVNPYRKDALERLDWAKRQGAVLVKWVPSVMLINPDDRSKKRRERLIRFHEKLVALDLPLLTHTGDEQSFPHPENELADPEKLELPLSLRVRVIAAHYASLGKYENKHGEEETGIVRLVRMMEKHPNLYADISVLTQWNRQGTMKDALTQKELLGRLLYGSDFPLINTVLVSPWNFIRRLTPGQFLSIGRTKNPWDKDVRIRQALGTPTAVFNRSREFFKK